MPPLTPKSSEITLSELNSLLPRYRTILHHLLMRDVEKKRKTGGELTEFVRLDRHRYTEIPSLLQKRNHDTGEAWLEKPELELLMKWKLKHGKFRPQLSALISSNPPNLVKSITREAFAIYSSSTPRDHTTAITQLSKLRGVGPATASLLLSVHDPTHAPFFSDELYRWICWDDKSGWERKIKYDAKEYRMLCQGFQVFRERLGLERGENYGTVRAVEVEKVAHVLGKCAGDGKLAAAVEEEMGKEEGDKEGRKAGEEEVQGEGKESGEEHGAAGDGKEGREISPPASKRAKLGADAEPKARGGRGTRVDGEEKKTAEEAEEAGGKAVTSTPAGSSNRAEGVETGGISTRRTSQRKTRGRPGGGINDDSAGVARDNKRKRKSKGDNS